ncbi:VPLPA-CTERM sorting domain-containing protein [Methylobacter psychrophilus]|uniref:VPLPA-CTERM sorting domain-containing protein n=1 Tax=Methylobacter psychrophilus TaxID=96941 RepID=UPI0021D49427|nr:VPLPA-CTERM sorting domain-containing protein [Methylobacter psychrophilus]
MTILRTTIATILAGAALAGVSTQASAISVSATPETFNATGTITNSAGTNVIGTSMNNAGGHILTAGTAQSAIYHDYTTVKSWADMQIDLGWMHAVDWVQLNITDSGTYQIKDEVIGLRNVAASWINQNTTISPSLTVWSLAGSTFTSTGQSNNATTVQSPLAYGYTTGGNNNKMGFNQVAAPSSSNNGNFLTAGGVNGIVGYSNSGVSGWYNGNGDLVGSGSAGASSGTNANGFKWTDLTVNLAAGSYILAIGGSCVDLQNCGPVTSINSTTGVKSWGTGWHELTVTAVPVPGAVWLFGSALAGFIGLRRRSVAA